MESIKQKKIAICGGAFNPPTIGHIRLIESVFLYTDVDNIWVMPSYTHMYGKQMVSFEDRLVMCELAFMKIGGVRVSSFEKAVGGDGSTINLMKALDEKYGDRYDFHFIIGQDNAETIKDWKEYGWLIDNIKFITVPRNVSEFNKEKWYTKEPHQFISEALNINASSTMAREAINKLSSDNHKERLEGQVVIDEILPPCVKEYGIELYK